MFCALEDGELIMRKQIKATMYEDTLHIHASGLVSCGLIGSGMTTLVLSERLHYLASESLFRKSSHTHDKPSIMIPFSWGRSLWYMHGPTVFMYSSCQCWWFIWYILHAMLMICNALGRNWLGPKPYRGLKLDLHSYLYKREMSL